MQDWMIANEAALRLVVFVSVFLAVALAEIVTPRRHLEQKKWLRWLNNLGVLAVDTLALRFVLPVLAVAFAVEMDARGIGLFNTLTWPLWLEFLLALLLFDLLIYAQHVAFHYIPVLWRLHKMHHADLDFDVTTGGRFHPVEIVLSMLIKLVAVAALGPAPAAVLVFEIILNGVAMFNHGNLKLPQRLDAALRLFVVTPDMHRVHHSIERRETNSNFGFNLPWWDRIFGTYRAQPAQGHEAMTIGIPEYRQTSRLWLHWMLLHPFLSKARLRKKGTP